MIQTLCTDRRKNGKVKRLKGPIVENNLTDNFNVHIKDRELTWDGLCDQSYDPETVGFRSSSVIIDDSETLHVSERDKNHRTTYRRHQGLDGPICSNSVT